MSGNWRFYNKMAVAINKRNLLDQEYPLDVAEQAVAEAQTMAEQGMLVGELNHPHFANVDLDRAVVKYTKIWIDYTDMTVRCDGELLLPQPGMLPNHPAWIILHLQNRGVQFGISHRSFTAFENGEEKTGKCLYMQILALDLVYGPAFPNNIVFTENSVFQCKCAGDCVNNGQCKDIKKRYDAYNEANAMLEALVSISPYWHRKTDRGVVYGSHPVFSTNRDLFDDLVNDLYGGEDVIIDFEEDTDEDNFIFADVKYW